MVNILLTGTYSSRNKGDAAMQIGCALELQRQMGQARVTIAAPFAEQDRPVYAPYGIEVVVSHRRRLGRCLIQMGLGRAGQGLARLFRVPDAVAIEQADLVLDLSGDGLTEDYGPHVVLSHLYPIWLATQMGKPVMLCAQTLGPFRMLGPIVRRILNRVACITARDAFTEQTLRELRVDGPIVRRTADLAHLLPASPRERTDQLLGKANASARPMLGVTLSRLLGHRHGAARRGQQQRRLESISEALQAMIDRHDLSVVLLAHSTGPKPGRDDRSITSELAASLRRPDRTLLLEGDLSPSDAKGVLGACDLVCATRLHSAIGALSQAIPCVVLGYGPKALGLMELWDQSRFTLPVVDVRPAVLFQALDAAWTSRAEIRADLSNRSERVLELARANVAIARSLLPES